MIDEIDVIDDIEIEDMDEFPLAGDEKQALERCEAVIGQGRETFLQVGAALSEIQHGKLYRMHYGTFEEYCRDRWDIGRGRAYQLMSSAKVAAELSTVVDKPPTNEREAREIAKSAPADRPRVIERATELAGDQPRTAKHIEAAAAEISAPDLPPEFAIMQRRLAAQGYQLLSHIQGSHRAYVTRKEGMTGVVTFDWADVLSKLERLEGQQDTLIADQIAADSAPVGQPNISEVAPARRTCPTCHELILNGIWGELNECGSCYHATQRVQTTPAPTLDSLDAALPKAIQDAGYFWQSAAPPIIAHNDGWRGERPTFEAALQLAHDREREKGDVAGRRLPAPIYVKVMDLIGKLSQAVVDAENQHAAKLARAIAILIEQAAQ